MGMHLPLSNSWSETNVLVDPPERTHENDGVSSVSIADNSRTQFNHTPSTRWILHAFLKLEATASGKRARNPVATLGNC